MSHTIPKISRRSVLAGVPATLLPGGLARAAQGPKRPKLAAIVTEWRYRSHAQNIVDRFLEGYGWATTTDPTSHDKCCRSSSGIRQNSGERKQFPQGQLF